MTRSGPSTFDPLAAAQTTLDTPLARILADRIRQDGPMTFHEWMKTCLYQPELGYYRRGRPTVGRDGDFLTSPEVHPLFGAAVGHVSIELWRQLDGPATFRVAEVGPGTGSLAESMLRHIRAVAPRLAEAIQYTTVEPDDHAAQALDSRLRVIHSVNRVHSINQLSGCQHLVVANELLDALPVHRLQFIDGAWRELRVNHSTVDGFHDAVGAVSEPSLLEPLGEITPGEGQIVEVAPDRGAITTSLARCVDARGLLLLFDYGYSRDRLYASWRRDGTLMTFRNHVPGDDPYAHPGEQDITTHVDIDQAEAAAQASGLAPLPRLSQSEWLHQLGAAVLPGVAESVADTNTYLSARRASETLTDPAGLGRIAVMGFTKGEIKPLPGWMPS